MDVFRCVGGFARSNPVFGARGELSVRAWFRRFSLSWIFGESQGVTGKAQTCFWIACWVLVVRAHIVALRPMQSVGIVRAGATA